ncbi:putative reverse transcriptase domain-containing protein [Tanacetum coccineum]
MRQRRWIELYSDYDCEIRYHPGKANVVANALSRKERVKPKRVRAKGLDEMIEQRSDGTLYYLDRIWVPLKGEVRTLIMDEAYKWKYSVHPVDDNMYYDLRDRYWWPGMKKDIAEYVSKCLTCLKVKAEHQWPSVLAFQANLEDSRIEMDRQDTMDFVTLRKYEHWSEKKRNWMDKSYRISHKDLVHLLSYVIVLYIPEELNGVHDTFHVSNLKKCLADPTLQVPLDDIRVDAKLNFVEDPVEILEREFKKLKRSRIAIVKVWWNSKRGPEFTWERKDQMKLKYPHLFSDVLECLFGSEGSRDLSIGMIVWIGWVRLSSICVIIGADGYAYPGESPCDMRGGFRSRGSEMISTKKTEGKPSQNVQTTEHGMEKTCANQGQSPKMPKVRVNTEESAVKPTAGGTEE